MLPFCLLLLSLALAAASGGSDYTTLVYKGCSDHPIPAPAGETLQALFASLVSQSSKTKFFKTTAGSAGDAGDGGGTTIAGLFQCRGDLGGSACHACVSKIPAVAGELCGGSAAARVQLSGCYAAYEVSGLSQVSGTEMLYKVCGSSNVAGSGFEERRDTALSVMENGVAAAGGGGGFFSTSYESVYVLGQCEGDLGGSDCGECVKSAVQRSQVECGSSISGQIYLQKCFITYSYNPNGVPTRQSSSSSSSSSTQSSSLSSSSSSSGSGSGQDTGKTVAIILGGTMGVGFLVICLMFARSLLKKKHDDY